MARPPYRLFEVVAEQVELVTPHMKRITFDGSCLPVFQHGLPVQGLKVFVPGATSGRAYTVLRFGPVSKKLDIDFVLHGDNGPASAWAARYLLFGDETSLPAIGSILEALPPHVRADAFVEVADDNEEQAIESAAAVNLTWLRRKTASNGTASGLEDAAKAIRRPDENTVVWIAAESSIVAALRKLALSKWGVDRPRLDAAGYWKRGEANHRDEEASP